MFTVRHSSLMEAEFLNFLTPTHFLSIKSAQTIAPLVCGLLDGQFLVVICRHRDCHLHPVRRFFITLVAWYPVVFSLLQIPSLTEYLCGTVSPWLWQVANSNLKVGERKFGHRVLRFALSP